MNYSVEEIIKILNDFDYPTSNKMLLHSVVTQLQNLTPEGRAAFEHWCDTRRVPEFNIEGITPDFLRVNHQATDVAIILAYDGLIRNPRQAILLKKPVIRRIKP